MKFLYLFLSIFSTFLNGGFSQQQTFESFFHVEMKRIHIWERNYSYKLIHKEINVVHQDDAVAVFKEKNIRGNQIFIAYFEKQNKQWKWKQTRGAEWDSSVQWSSMHKTPFIYSGTLSGDSIIEVYAGKEPAKIIDVEEGKRFWYAISPIKEVEVLVVKKDGTKEILEEFDFKGVSSKY